MSSRPSTLHLPLAAAMLHQAARRAAADKHQDVATVRVEPPAPAHWDDEAARGASLQHAPVAAPTYNERATMAAHGIQFDGRGFLFAGCRHLRLADAVHQSRLAGQGCE